MDRARTEPRPGGGTAPPDSRPRLRPWGGSCVLLAFAYRPGVTSGWTHAFCQHGCWMHEYHSVERTCLIACQTSVGNPGIIATSVTLIQCPVLKGRFEFFMRFPFSAVSILFASAEQCTCYSGYRIIIRSCPQRGNVSEVWGSVFEVSEYFIGSSVAHQYLYSERMNYCYYSCP